MKKQKKQTKVATDERIDLDKEPVADLEVNDEEAVKGGGTFGGGHVGTVR